MPHTENSASALGEAVGALMEQALQVRIGLLAGQFGASLYTQGPISPSSGKPTKLKLSDQFGTEYHLDGVIVDRDYRPIVLLESKFIRYTKHNRDKGSWICHAHTALRNQYASVRTSLAVLAGNWSHTSLAMLRSYNINVLLIPFEDVANTFLPYGVDLRWEEKDSEKKAAAWNFYQQLDPAQRSQIGEDMIDLLSPQLDDFLAKSLDVTTERVIDSIRLEIHSNLSEVTRRSFRNLGDAIKHLTEIDATTFTEPPDSLTLEKELRHARPI